MKKVIWVILVVVSLVIYSLAHDWLKVALSPIYINSGQNGGACNQIIYLKGLRYIDVKVGNQTGFYTLLDGDETYNDLYFPEFFNIKSDSIFATYYQITSEDKNYTVDRLFNLSKYKINLNTWTSSQLCMNDSAKLANLSNITSQQIQEYDGLEVKTEGLNLKNQDTEAIKLYYFPPALVLLVKDIDQSGSLQVLGAKFLQQSKVVGNKIIYPEHLYF